MIATKTYDARGYVSPVCKTIELKAREVLCESLNSQNDSGESADAQTDWSGAVDNSWRF